MPPLRSSPTTGPASSSRKSRIAATNSVVNEDVEHRGRDPADLGDADGDGVGDRGTSSLPDSSTARRGSSRPTSAMRMTDVAGDHDPVVEVLARVRCSRSTCGNAEGQDDDADHLHERRDPEQPVVVVERGREPRVVDPGPAHANTGRRIRRARLQTCPVGEVVGELVRDGAERDDERQVVEQARGAWPSRGRVRRGRAPASDEGGDPVAAWSRSQGIGRRRPWAHA